MSIPLPRAVKLATGTEKRLYLVRNKTRKYMSIYIKLTYSVIHHLRHMSTATCFGTEVPSSGGVIITKVYKPTCQSGLFLCL